MAGSPKREDAIAAERHGGGGGGFFQKELLLLSSVEVYLELTCSKNSFCPMSSNTVQNSSGARCPTGV